MKTNRYLELLRDTAVFAAGNFLVKLIQLFLVPLYTTVMTTAEYGVAELANNLTEMLGPMVTLGVSVALFRFMLEENSQRQRLFSNSAAVLFMGLAITIIAGTIIDIVFGYAYTWHMALVLCSSAIYSTLSFFARGSQGAAAYALGALVNVVTLCTANIVLLVYLRSGPVGYLFSIAIANGASSVFLILKTRAWRYFSLGQISPGAIRPLLVFSIPIMFTSLAWWFINMPGRYVLLWYHGNSAAGVLAAASKLPAIISVFAATFQLAWQIASSKEYDAGAPERFYFQVFRCYSALVLAAGSLVIAFTPLLARLLLKGDFHEAAAYLPWLMLSAILHCFTTYFGSLYIACKNTRRAMISIVLGAAVNLFLCFMLIPGFGVWGSVMAGLTSYIVINISRVLDTRRLVKIDLSAKMVLPCLLLLFVQAASAPKSLWSNAACCGAIILLALLSVKKDMARLWRMIFAKRLWGRE